MIRQYLRPGFAFALAHAVEEAGEFLAAAGKTQRWGPESVNPELPESEQETNVDWLAREMVDLQGAIGRLGVAIVGDLGAPRRFGTPWSTEVDVIGGAHVRVGVMLSLDDGPMREFRPFLDVDLDEAHATELVGKLMLAVQEMRRLRDSAA